MSALLPERYKKFEDLPNHVKVAIERLAPGDLDEFVCGKMPAAGNRSIIEILNKEGEAGEQYVLSLIGSAMSK
jgi:hypothetical protein